MRSVQGRWGECFYFGKDEYVGRSIHNYGEYNPEETEMILSLAVPGKLCLDIGANIGVMSQALAANGHLVVGFEPQPEVYKLLCKNHSGENHNCGLGDVECTAVMPKIRYDEKNNVGGMGIGFRSVLGTINVQVKTLDSFDFQDVGFMKIDVEGFEEAVLRGGVQMITRDKPIMYIEDDRKEKSASLRSYITSLGYTIEEHYPPLYREENFFGLRKNIWDRNYVSHNIICRPV